MYIHLYTHIYIYIYIYMFLPKKIYIYIPSWLFPTVGSCCRQPSCNALVAGSFFEVAGGIANREQPIGNLPVYITAYVYMYI